MAKKKAAKKPPQVVDDKSPINEFTTSGVLPTFTGRLLVSARDGDASVTPALFEQAAKECSLKTICHSSDYAGEMSMEQADGAEFLVFDEFGIGVVSANSDNREHHSQKLLSLGLRVEQERWNYEQDLDDDLGLDPSAPADSLLKLGDSSPTSLEYLKGFRDGLDHVIARLENQPHLADESLAFAADFADSATATWGLQATGVLGSMHSGAGVKVAVLDSGFDATHPHYTDGRVTTASFIPASTPDRFGRLIPLSDRDANADVSGHGTHCIGTACGPKTPPTGVRYGVAHGSQVFSGKVLSVIVPGRPAGGKDAWILSGFRWAIQNGCSIISMSLGSKVSRGERFVQAYEDLAGAAFRNNVLCVAAAGNDSDRRFNVLHPVSSPANCPSIVSVAAVTRQTSSSGVHGLAYFSNRHLNDFGGEVNFAGPGYEILSSFPNPRTRLMNGTSQATPHVAGIAAMVQEETGKTGRDLYLELRSRVKAQGARVDYGNGLIHV